VVDFLAAVVVEDPVVVDITVATGPVA